MEEKRGRGRPKKGEVVQKKEVVLKKYRGTKETRSAGAGRPESTEEQKHITKTKATIRKKVKLTSDNIKKAVNANKVNNKFYEETYQEEKIVELEINNYELYVKPNLDLIEDLYRNNVKEKDIYTALGISQNSWYDYLKKYEELRELKRISRTVALAQVENAMFKRATGVKIKKQVAMKVSDKTFDEKTGKMTGVTERIEIVEIEEEIPADGNLAFKILEVKRRKEYAKNVDSETSENKLDKLFGEIKKQIAPNTEVEEGVLIDE